MSEITQRKETEGEVPVPLLPVPLLPHTGTHSSIYWALPNVVKLTQCTARNRESEHGPRLTGEAWDSTVWRSEEPTKESREEQPATQENRESVEGRDSWERNTNGKSCHRPSGGRLRADLSSRVVCLSTEQKRG